MSILHHSATAATALFSAERCWNGAIEIMKILVSFRCFWGRISSSYVNFAPLRYCSDSTILRFWLVFVASGVAFRLHMSISHHSATAATALFSARRCLHRAIQIIKVMIMCNCSWGRISTSYIDCGPLPYCSESTILCKALLDCCFRLLRRSSCNHSRSF